MYNALIFGAGKIASDFDSPSSESILTHAYAYAKHPDFNLLGFYDIDVGKAKLAAQKWNCDYFKNISDIRNVDVISICTPDDFHAESVKQAVKFRPKLIFLEKPITNNISEIPYLIDVAKNIPIAVNYSRRYLKEFQNLSQRISSGEFEDFSTGIGYYGKGFIHNGSHMVDLLRLLIGDIKYAEKLSQLVDFFPGDPSWNADVFFQNNVKFSMRSVDCNNFTIFELDLLFEKARIRILDSGFRIEIYKVANDRMFDGYRKLQKVDDFSTELKMAMFYAVDNISNFLQGQEKLLCDIHDGYEAIKYA